MTYKIYDCLFIQRRVNGFTDLLVLIMASEDEFDE